MHEFVRFNSVNRHFTLRLKKAIVNSVRAGLSLRNVHEVNGVPKGTVSGGSP